MLHSFFVFCMFLICGSTLFKFFIPFKNFKINWMGGYQTNPIEERLQRRKMNHPWLQIKSTLITINNAERQRPMATNDGRSRGALLKFKGSGAISPSTPFSGGRSHLYLAGTGPGHWYNDLSLPTSRPRARVVIVLEGEPAKFGNFLLATIGRLLQNIFKVAVSKLLRNGRWSLEK